MPTDVRKIAQLALKDQYQFVDCVGEEESTHQHVPQQYTVCGQEQQVREGFCLLLFSTGMLYVRIHADIGVTQSGRASKSWISSFESS